MTINSYTDPIIGGEQFNEGLIVSHINVRSLRYISQRKLVVGISETWLDESV